MFDASSANMDALVDNLSIEPRLALDTESDPFHRYYEKVCLLQISTIEDDYIFDPLKAGIAPKLKALFEDRARTIVLHGGDYDVRSLKRSFGLTLGRIFDTSIAAMMLGHKELGLKALLEKELQVQIDKAEQRSDWGQRPLTEEQLAYAVADARHLLPLADKLTAALEAAGRLAWMEEECEGLRSRTPGERVFDPEGYRAVAGVRKLAPSGRRAARALFSWREDQARSRDVPAFRVLPNDVLVFLASHLDESGKPDQQAIARLRRLTGGPELPVISEVIERGLSVEEPPEARVRDDVAKRVERDVFKARMERLRLARTEQSSKLGIDPGFLAPASILEKLARDPPPSVDALRAIAGMTAWRVDVVGRHLLVALES